MEESIDSGLTPKNIADFRKDRKLSPQGLATLLCVGVATINRWEKGLKPTGTAAVILQALVAKYLGHEPKRPRREPEFREAYTIFRELKEIFEPSD